MKAPASWLQYTWLDHNKSKLYIAVFFVLAFASLGNPAAILAQSFQKVVQGRVLNPGGQPQAGAIVYLKNDKTGDIKSFISIADGSYRFGQLSADIDYELWAELDSKKSVTKTLSSFDSRKSLIYELKLGTGK
jgi:hypothetical protein